MKEKQEKKFQPWEVDYRIPSTTKSVHYDLWLYPKLAKDAFDGRVTIHVDNKEKRSHFVAHVKHLSVKVHLQQAIFYVIIYVHLHKVQLTKC